MAGTVVIKFGGGLITDKENICTPNLSNIDSLCKTLAKIDRKIILIHGAGSFGHMKSKQARLSEGRLDYLEQDNAVNEVRTDMVELNKLVLSALTKYGLKAESFPPRDWAIGTGPNFAGKLPICEGVTITFGDVVPDDNKEFGILSGDDLMYRYATVLENIDCVIFAMGGVDGLLRVPPDVATGGDLFSTWSPNMTFEGEHATEFDVTGGIGLKVTRGSMIAELGIDVWLVNGEHPERIIDIIDGKSTIGTKIVSGNS